MLALVWRLSLLFYGAVVVPVRKKNKKAYENREDKKCYAWDQQALPVPVAKLLLVAEFPAYEQRDDAPACTQSRPVKNVPSVDNEVKKRKYRQKRPKAIDCVRQAVSTRSFDAQFVAHWHACCSAFLLVHLCSVCLCIIYYNKGKCFCQVLISLFSSIAKTLTAPSARRKFTVDTWNTRVLLKTEHGHGMYPFVCCSTSCARWWH